jgi:Mrp family chromosome partitioning ATPase
MQDHVDPTPGPVGIDRLDSEAYSWLKSPTGETIAPIFFTTAVRVGIDPWQDDLLRRELDGLAQGLETSGPDGSGRILMVTDLVEEPEARVRVATSLAADLAARGLRVALVDADLRFVGLARYLPEESGEAEGFVDALEYGASGSALLRPTPVPGVQSLPMGSYRPDHTHRYEDEALRRVARQLRGAADVILVLAPAWNAEGRFHAWMVHSDAVVLSFDLDRSMAEALEELHGYLEGLGIDLAAMVARVSSDPADGAVDVALADAPAGAGSYTSPYSRMDTRDSQGGSSAGVRRLALLLLVVLLAFVGWWSWTEWQSGQSEEAPMQVQRLTPPSTADIGETSSPLPTTTDEDELATPVAAADSTAVASGESTESRPAEPPAASPVETEPAAATPSPAEDAAPESTALPPEMLLPVGEGWALHPWSFADSTEAVRASRSLEELGMHPAVRAAEVEGRTWYRVLVGRFASRRDAWQVRDRLAAEVETDWVGVVRVNP